MQAAVFTEIKKPLAVQAVPNPLAALGEAVVQLKAAALNHRDLWIQLGQYAGIKTPMILGSDGAGTVLTVGSPKDTPWVGREVIINPALDSTASSAFPSASASSSPFAKRSSALLRRH